MLSPDWPRHLWRSAVKDGMTSMVGLSCAGARMGQSGFGDGWRLGGMTPSPHPNACASSLGMRCAGDLSDHSVNIDMGV